MFLSPILELFFFRIVLGYPTGGAGLSEDTVCDVSIANDIAFGVVSFPHEEVSIAQSAEELSIPVQRTQNKNGKK